MQVIGAGMSRTGTLSTRVALERLGYPCYHMTEVPRAEGHLDAWVSYLSGQAELDWPTLFDAYEASVDTPACLCYREMMQAFPKARVLLNVRDPEKWYESLVTLSETLEELRPLASRSIRLAKFFRLTDAVGGILTNGDFSRENCIRAFRAHNDAVQEYVASDRLLVFQVQEGWAPLCAFLEQDVPNEPFPYLNEGRSFITSFINEAFLASD